ncbi:PREDICTED: metal tolerance protein 9-like [Tarenaya hassleriana]|uniref:metal tolerance protein 9-like n=1 Tax=Tarenaya hassleriana TaxID=28532 RepID=UPI00053C13E2|nr:PREDICTED: metal tolerance protein 9-like [Tarenaya hassleriana]
MGSNERTDSSDYRTELLSPAALGTSTADGRSPVHVAAVLPSWKLHIDGLHLPDPPSSDSTFTSLCFSNQFGRRRKIARYYKKQEKLVEGFRGVDSFTELGVFPPNLNNLSQDGAMERSERVAVYTSNAANLVLFIAKVYASVQSRSMAVVASTLDSLLDLLSGFILWFTHHKMRKPNQYRYPIGKNRMQPVGIVVFASVMATLGLQVLFESVREFISKAQPEREPEKMWWMIGIMVSVTLVKLVLMMYCRRFENDIVRAYAQDHFFDVVTNSLGLAFAVLAVRFYWWFDQLGAILIALYTVGNWSKTVKENVKSLVGRGAPAEYITKLTYMIWNHDERIRHIETVRAYTFGTKYFVEVDIVLPSELSLGQAHNVGELLQERLELLPEVERAFVHLDIDATHQPEHRPKRQ